MTRTPLGLAAGLAAMTSSVVAPISAAQDDEAAGGLVLEAPASAAAMAFGDAPNLFGSDPGLLFYAPALISRGSGAAVSLQRYDWEGTLASVAGAGSLLGGGLAVGAQYMRYGTSAGPPGLQDRQSLALSGGEVGISEFVVAVGYSRTVRAVEAGIVLKHVEETVDGSTDAAPVLDLGLAKEIGPVMVSVSARNLGPELEIETGGGATELELPTQLTIGATLEQFEAGPLDVFVTGRVTRRQDGEVVPAGGLEISYWPITGYTFRLRGGLQRVVDDRRSPFTLGAAFTRDDLTIEWAFQPFDGEGSAYRLGLRWR